MRWLCTLTAVLVICSFQVAPIQAAEWTANEITEYYAVDGQTGLELYQAIGGAGPIISGSRRTIAVTNWDLKWRRNYQPDESSCVLVDALPFVSITYTLPRPAQKLPANIAAKWQRFADGIKAHELVHGDLVKKLTRNIIKATVGLRVQNDPNCQKIRDEVLSRVKIEFDLYTIENRNFERSEMAEGGNVQRLILALIQ